MTLPQRLFSIFFGIIFLTGLAVAQQSKRDEGIDLFRDQKFAEAAAKLEEATAVDATDRHAWLYLAASYKHLDREKDAEAAFKSSMFIQKTGAPKYDKNVKITKKIVPRPNGPLSGSERYSVAVELRADGTVGVVIPYSTAPGNNKDTAVYAAKKIEFEPAIKNGKPVSVIQVLEYKFDKY